MVKEQKVKLKGEELCKDLPSMNIMNIIYIEPFAMLFNYSRNLDFEQKPDYGYFKKGLKSVLDNLGLGTVRP